MTPAPLFQTPRPRRVHGRRIITRAAKAERMTETPPGHVGTDMILGELRGQMREVVHTTNNTAQKVDAVIRDLTPLQGMPALVTALSVRVTALETDRNRRDGATGVIGTLMKSPTLGWLVGAVVSAYMVLTGKVTLP